ncbi:hypothetical protein ACK8GG_17035 [Micromonosporaceae bacterium DT55]|uniref:hypothetical protein n=1 Tax=Melissospora conviva TaxID=3388432 RepID=UPI003C293AE3
MPPAHAAETTTAAEPVTPAKGTKATRRPARTAKKTAAKAADSKTPAVSKTTAKKTTAGKTTTGKTAAEKTTGGKAAVKKAAPAKKAAGNAAAGKAAPEPLPGLTPRHEPSVPTAPLPGSAEPAAPPQAAAPIAEPAAPPQAGTPTTGPTIAPASEAHRDTAQGGVGAATAMQPALAATGNALVRVDESPNLPAPTTEPAVPATGTPALAVLRRLAAQPVYAPELLALAAVQSLGPAAKSWADEVRSTYPDVTTAGLVRLATGRYDRMAKAGGALASLAGVAGPVLEGATLAWTQAGLLLHLAAAHDQDPTHPDRAAELLAFTGVHPDLTSARNAVGRAVDATGPDTEPTDDPVRDVAEAGRRLAVPLAWQTGAWATLRLLTRRLPGAGPLLAGIACADVNRRLASRAIAHYRATSAPAGRR